MLGTAKVVGSNLSRICFFFQTGNVLFQIKFPANYVCFICCRLSCRILKSFFFCCAHFFYVPFSV